MALSAPATPGPTRESLAPMIMLRKSSIIIYQISETKHYAMYRQYPHIPLSMMLVVVLLGSVKGFLPFMCLIEAYGLTEA